MNLLGFFNAQSVPSDPYFPGVSALLHCDGAGGGILFPDSSSHAYTVTRAGSGVTTTTGVKKFGTAAATFTSANSYLTLPDGADFTFGAGDFTLEGWFYILSLPTAATYQGLICQRYSNSVQFAFALYLNGDNSGAVRFDWTTSGDGTSGAFAVLGPSVPSLNTWHHIAAVRSGSSCVVYLDGVGGTAVNVGTATMYNSTNPVALGILSTSVGGYFSGIMDEVRITKGVARYTSNFTVPTSAFPNS